MSPLTMIIWPRFHNHPHAPPFARHNSRFLRLLPSLQAFFNGDTIREKLWPILHQVEQNLDQEFLQAHRVWVRIALMHITPGDISFEEIRKQPPRSLKPRRFLLEQITLLFVYFDHFRCCRYNCYQHEQKLFACVHQPLEIRNWGFSAQKT